jgi:hypothetical protein
LLSPHAELDLENPQDKEFIEKSFDWTLEIDGKKWADGEFQIARLRTSRCPTSFAERLWYPF